MSPVTPSPVQPPALAEAGGLVLAPLPYPPIRVLCVDDNRDAADSLGTLLRMVGFVTEVCHDAAAALAAVERFRPDACVLDVCMIFHNRTGAAAMSTNVEYGGCELARVLRSGPGGEKLLLVAVTALGDSGAKARTAEAGFDLHLTKPADPQRLIDVLFGFERRVRGAVAAAHRDRGRGEPGPEPEKHEPPGGGT
jgi:CheY-like chemotaxis protein